MGVDNGVGLVKDWNILRELLSPYYDIFFIDMEIKNARLRGADLNIFLEKVVRPYMRLAPINVLIPNPEWYYWGEKQAQQFDYIFAKTKDTERIFTERKCRVIFTSFTSENHYNSKIKKERVFIHSPGKSETKGSDIIWRTWIKEPDLPKLIFCRMNHFEKYTQKPKNVDKCFIKFQEDEFRILQNSCYFHLCTSEYEGWGHYLHEAKSLGAIVFTANAPPMNTFITKDMGFLIDVQSREKRNSGILCKISGSSLKHEIRKAIQLDDNRLKQLSDNTIQSFHDNDRFFRWKFLETIKNII